MPLSKKTGPWASFLFVLALLLTACDNGEAPGEFRYQGQTMGTTFHITVVPNGGRSLPAEMTQLIEGELARINSLMSTYLEDSELSLFNRQQVDIPYSVSGDFCQLLLLSREVYTLSGGAFNPAVGPLVNLWGFGPDVNGGEQVPEPDQIQRLLEEINFLSLSADCDTQGDGGSLTKRQPISLDFSAVAKGYAADRVGRLIAERGYTNYLVEIGGELALSGLKSSGQPWRIAVEKPTLAQGGVQLIATLTNVGVATSGDYRNYFERDGVRYSHTIDPRTGWPVTHNLASVTVVAENAAKADALATAFMVLGFDASLALAERENLAAYFIVKQGDGFAEQASSGFLDYIAKGEEG